MGNENPPDSWYDPPEPKHDLEIKWERLVTNSQVKCDNCGEVAFMYVQIGDIRYCGGEFKYICKNHYETIYDDTIEEIESYEPDYEED